MNMTRKQKMQEVIDYYFQLKNVKPNPSQRQHSYGYHARHANALLDMTDHRSVAAATDALRIVAEWADSINRNWEISTAVKYFLQLDDLKPKKEPYYNDWPMKKRDDNGQWFVVINGEWLKFAGEEEEIEWR